VSDAASRATKGRTGAQSDFDDDQQPSAARNDIEFSHAAAEVAREDFKAVLLHVQRGAFFGLKAKLPSINRHGAILRATGDGLAMY
jgi:hypothetical protein